MSTSRTLPPVSIGGIKPVRSIERSMLAVLCALVLAFFLSACDPASNSPSIPSGPATTGKPIASITAPAPPGSTERPLQPGQSGTQFMPNGLPVLPAKGLNADMLFAEKITDTDDRFRRLENAVVDLRKEFDAVAPAIIRLSAIEQDMQTLLAQLQTLTQDAPPAPVMDLEPAPVPVVMNDALPPPAPTGLKPQDTAPPPEAAVNANPPVNALPAVNAQGPPPATPPPMAQAPPPVAAPTPAPATVPAPKLGQNAVQGIRTGNPDNGALRLVLDLSGPTPYSFDLDNNEHLLVIELPQAGWSAPLTGTFANAPLLTSWTTEPSKDGGVRLIIQLKQNAQVVKNMALTGPARIMFDLK